MWVGLNAALSKSNSFIFCESPAIDSELLLEAGTLFEFFWQSLSILMAGLEAKMISFVFSERRSNP